MRRRYAATVWFARRWGRERAGEREIRNSTSLRPVHRDRHRHVRIGRRLARRSVCPVDLCRAGDADIASTRPWRCRASRGADAGQIITSSTACILLVDSGVPLRASQTKLSIIESDDDDSGVENVLSLVYFVCLCVCSWP